MTRLLFNCDDFGKTAEVNAAVLKAHREGLLGSASLMVTGDAFSEAVEIARSNPSLKVGLHLALNDAHPALPATQIPDLVDSSGTFFKDPAKIGMRIILSHHARIQAVTEIAAQFERFAATGLPRSHVDGHYHLHMHPFIFQECIRWAEKLGFTRIRVTREFSDPLPPRQNLHGFVLKLTRHFTFLFLADACDHFLINSSIQAFDGVLGLWETGGMNEDYLLKTLGSIDEDYLLKTVPHLPDGDWEVYMHLGALNPDEELIAMLSPKLKEMLQRQGIVCL